MWEKIKVQENISLAQYSTFKIGGPAKFFFLAKTREDLIEAIREAKKNNLAVFVLGAGSNLLISDEGFNGLVIKCEIAGIEIKENKIIASAGEKIVNVLNFVRENNLGGMEFLAGAPATVGGAVWANFGALGGEVADILDSVEILDENLEIKKINQEECQFAYRESIFKHKNYFILSAAFKLKKRDKAKIEKDILVNLGKRMSIYPSAGSVFRNPDGKKAWQLIDEVDMRGYKIGGAMVSEKHSNFIINAGGAKASDVVMLISLIKQKVRDNLGIELQEEIKYVGF